jgi:lysozyme
MINKTRAAVASLVVSATTLVGIAMHEGYMENAYLDSVGVPTIGFGETNGVQLGQKTSPTRALATLLQSADKHAQGMSSCIQVPIHQHEFDAYISLTYNIGVGNFCRSTLVKKLNAQDYGGACKEILRWNRAGGQVLNGLTKRRQQEYKKCIGE